MRLIDSNRPGRLHARRSPPARELQPASSTRGATTRQRTASERALLNAPCPRRLRTVHVESGRRNGRQP